MAFRIDSLDVNGEFVGVRIWATDSLEERETGSNCGVLVFTLDEWLAFHALLAGRSDAVPVEFRGFDRVRAELAAGANEVSTSKPAEMEDTL